MASRMTACLLLAVFVKLTCGDGGDETCMLQFDKRVQLPPVPQREEILKKLPDNVRKLVRDLPAGSQAGASQYPCSTEGKDLLDSGIKAGTLAATYRERFANNFCEKPQGMWPSAATGPIREWKYGAMGEALGLKPGMHVVDIGTGCGTELDKLVSTRGFVGYGVDVHKKVVEWASQRLKSGKFCLADGSHMPFEDNSVDAVISNAAFHHLGGLTEQTAGLKEIARILRSGGCAWLGYMGVSGGIDTVLMDAWASADIPAGMELATVSEAKMWGLIVEGSDADLVEYSRDDTYALIACKI